MTRNTAREIAMHLAYELSFNDLPVEEFLDLQLSAESFAALAPEHPIYEERPNAKQEAYIRRLALPSMRRWRSPRTTNRRRW